MDEIEIFLEAINKIPDDPYSAKFDGFETEEKQRQTKPKNTFDMTVDLHGFKKHEAIHKLKMILSKSGNSGQRILVITGRGNNSEDGIGVIRDAIRNYLECSGKKYIRSYYAAPPKYGGDGAIIIVT